MIGNEMSRRNHFETKRFSPLWSSSVHEASTGQLRRSFEGSCDVATDSHESLFVNPDDKYGNYYRYDNYTYKCIVKEVRRDQLNHKWPPARYRNPMVRELYRCVGGQSRLFINPIFA